MISFISAVSVLDTTSFPNLCTSLLSFPLRLIHRISSIQIKYIIYFSVQLYTILLFLYFTLQYFLICNIVFSLSPSYRLYCSLLQMNGEIEWTPNELKFPIESNRPALSALVTGTGTRTVLKSISRPLLSQIDLIKSTKEFITPLTKTLEDSTEFDRFHSVMAKKLNAQLQQSVSPPIHENLTKKNKSEKRIVNKIVHEEG